MVKQGDRFERYLVGSLLAEGGMGAVFLAHDERLDRRVALKVLRDEGSAAQQGEGRQRLLREARAAASLHHTNAVAIYDVGEVDGTPFIAMEFVRGQTLRAFLAPDAAPWQTKLRWLIDAARALDAAHRAGIVHRDVKPDNVMVNDEGVVKVLDFGIARRQETPIDPVAPTQHHGLSTLTARGVQIGTPIYMAPEQIRGEALDSRSDQFSWGVLAYELLTGRLPWKKTGDTLAVVAAILTEEPEPLAPLLLDLPGAAEQVILRALRKKPQDRHPDMDSVIRALDPLVRDDPSPALPPSPRGALPSEASPDLVASPPARGASPDRADFPPDRVSSDRAAPPARGPGGARKGRSPASPPPTVVPTTLMGQAYSEEEVQEILQRALDAPERPGRLDYRDLMLAARELGMNEHALERAARDIGATRSVEEEFAERMLNRRHNLFRHAGIYFAVSLGLSMMLGWGAGRWIFFGWGIALVAQAMYVLFPGSPRRRRERRRRGRRGEKFDGRRLEEGIQALLQTAQHPRGASPPGAARAAEAGKSADSSKPAEPADRVRVAEPVRVATLPEPVRVATGEPEAAPIDTGELLASLASEREGRARNLKA